MDNRIPRLEATIHELRQIWERIRKNPNRKYTKDFVENKWKEVEILVDESESSIKIDGLYEQIYGNQCWEVIKDLKEKIRKCLRNKSKIEEFLDALDDSLDSMSKETGQEVNQNSSENILNMASFGDIASALEKFDGRNKPVKVWLAAFESVATSCAFTPVAKYIHCRQLLTGTARLAVESEEDVGDYEKLKTYLLATFVQKTKTLDVYQELMSTRKNIGEPSEQYAFRMKRISNGGKLDEGSLMDLIIAGLPGSPLEKVTLKGATSFNDFREKLVAYDQLLAEMGSAKAKASSKSETARCGPVKTPNSEGNSRSFTGNCFTCGKPGHAARDCFKNVKCEKCKRPGHSAEKCRGVRCYKCGEEGHIAPQCPKTTA